jgi:heme A synthase
LKHPLLDWENEIQAVKNTRSVMVSAIGVFVYTLLLVALAFITRTLTSGNHTITILVLGLVPLAATVGLAMSLFRNADRHLQRMDV